MISIYDQSLMQKIIYTTEAPSMLCVYIVSGQSKNKTMNNATLGQSQQGGSHSPLFQEDRPLKWSNYELNIRLRGYS